MTKLSPAELKLSPEELKEIIQRHSKGPEVSFRTAGPYRVSSTEIAKKFLIVQPLPQGALPTYHSESVCYNHEHSQYLRPVSQCDHPECVTRYVLEA